MSKYRGVFISGTGGTGSTLMRRLFMSFQETTVSHTELRVDDFVALIARHKAQRVRVATRSFLSVFSHSLPDEEIARQLAVLQKNKIGVLVMARDFEAASASRSASITHPRWVAAYSQAFKYWENVDYLCNYYRLIAMPDVVQGEIAKAFDLTIVHKFSQYPDFCKALIGKGQDPSPQHSFRRIGAPYDKTKPRK